MFKSSSLYVAGIVALAATAVHAAPILDANYKSTGTYISPVAIYPGGAITDTAQTFTVQNTGNIVQLGLQVTSGIGAAAPTGNLQWQIVRNFNSANSTVLATGLIGADQFSSTIPSDWYVVSGFSVAATQGEVLAIVLHNAGTGYFGWIMNSNTNYVGGSDYSMNYTTSTTGTWGEHPGYDNGFAIYVDTVPEPASLGILSLAAAAILRRRK